MRLDPQVQRLYEQLERELDSFHVRFCQATCVTFPLFFYI